MGLGGSVLTSTFGNVKFSAEVRPTVEFNVFQTVILRIVTSNCVYSCQRDLSEEGEYLAPVEDMDEVIQVLQIVTRPLHQSSLEYVGKYRPV